MENNKLLTNNITKGIKLSHELIYLLNNCETFFFSIAFISKSGLAVLKQTLIDLETRGIKGKIITSTYLNFNQPDLFEELLKFSNIEVSIYNENNIGFHSKGYIFKNKDTYTSIIGSSNLTQNALSINQEWNIKTITNKNDSFTKELIEEYTNQWNKSFKLNQQWIDNYKNNYIPPNHILKPTNTLTPNTMQQAALSSLNKIRQENKNKALIISATGTGKTYLSAFDVKNINPNRLLFIVHRKNITINALASFKNIINNHSFGIFTGNKKDSNANYIFATIQTICKEENYQIFKPDTFDYIIIDEVHRIGSLSYQKIINYFKPKFMLGMSATPERLDNFDIYKTFDYNIAYEIRLQQAMEYNLLCPFHYYGITDLIIDGKSINDKTTFNNLISNQRVDHIIKQIKQYGYSGNKVKGLIFCSRSKEANELSKLFNKNGYKTVALNSQTSEDKRQQAIEQLESDDINNYLDYIFTVDIFNEGIDIPKINQIVMLRPTQSSTIFIQQLGRGLRIDKDKEYLVVIDFIANYDKNFLIPIALSGNQNYDKDALRRFINNDTLSIYGPSSINFDLITKEKIYQSIDKANFSDINIIKESYQLLKQKIGKIPTMMDFEFHNAIDILKIFQNKNFTSYHKFLCKQEKDYHIKFTSLQENYLSYVSTKLASGKRLHELLAIKLCIENNQNIITSLKEQLLNNYNITYNELTTLSIINQLQQNFATGGAKKTYQNAIFINNDLEGHSQLLELLQDQNFKNQLLEIINLGIYKNQKNYKQTYKNTDLCLYQKYTYEDVCRLLNWQVNAVPLNIGGYKYDQRTNTMPVFINHDDDSNNGGKYSHRFINSSQLICFSKPNRSIDCQEIQRIYQKKDNHIQIHLFVRKNKNDTTSKEFYYMGLVHAINEPINVTLPDNKNSAIQFTYQLETPIKKELYNYLTNKT